MSTQPPTLMVLKILWGAFVASQVLMGGVFWVVMAPPELEQPRVLVPILTGMGVAMPLIGLVAPRILHAAAAKTLPADADASRLLAAFFPGYIVGMALRESGAIFGGIVLLLFAEPLYWAVPAGTAFAASLVGFPSDSVVARWHETVTGRRPPLSGS